MTARDHIRNFRVARSAATLAVAAALLGATTALALPPYAYAFTLGGAAAEEGAPASTVVLSYEIPSSYHVGGAVVAGSSLADLEAMLERESSYCAFANANPMEATGPETCLMTFAWDASAVGLSAPGRYTLKPSIELEEGFSWGVAQPDVSYTVHVVNPHAPSLAYWYRDWAGTLTFPWAGVGEDDLAASSITVQKKGSDERMPLDESPWGRVSTNGAFLYASRIEPGTYILTLTDPSGMKSSSEATVTQEDLSVIYYEGDRDAGDGLGNGLPGGMQPSPEPSNPPEDEPSGSEPPQSNGGIEENPPAPQPTPLPIEPPANDRAYAEDGSNLEAYGPNSITLSGTRMNDLATRRTAVLFDFGRATVSIPSEHVRSLSLAGNDSFTVAISGENENLGASAWKNGQPVNAPLETDSASTANSYEALRHVGPILAGAACLALALALGTVGIETRKRRKALSRSTRTPS